MKTDISFGQTQWDETIYFFSPQYVQSKFEKKMRSWWNVLPQHGSKYLRGPESASTLSFYKNSVLQIWVRVLTPQRIKRVYSGYFTCVVFYRKVASSSLSRLVAHFQLFSRLMKGKFDANVLWPLAKKFQNWIVDLSIAHDFMVSYFNH